MQTAMYEMIDYLLSVDEYDLVNKAGELLRVEKNQIMDAYYHGGDDGCPNGLAGNKAAKQYYTNTFMTDENI